MLPWIPGFHGETSLTRSPHRPQMRFSECALMNTRWQQRQVLSFRLGLFGFRIIKTANRLSTDACDRPTLCAISRAKRPSFRKSKICASSSGVHPANDCVLTSSPFVIDFTRPATEDWARSRLLAMATFENPSSCMRLTSNFSLVVHALGSRLLVLMIPLAMGITRRSCCRARGAGEVVQVRTRPSPLLGWRLLLRGQGSIQSHLVRALSVEER